MPAPEWDLKTKEKAPLKDNRFTDMLSVEEIHGDKYLILKKTANSPGGFSAHNDEPKNDDILVKFIEQ